MDLTATLEQIGHAMPDLSTIVPDWMNQWFHTLGTNSVFLSTQNYMPPLLVALFLGLLIGIERRRRHKVAGVRTNMVVAASSCLITMVGLVVFEATKLGDPARLPGQIIAGITFLGAGVIWKHGWKTQGITTAALILFSTVTGILCGFGYLMWATTATISVVIVVQLSYWLFPSDDSNEHTLRFVCPLEKFDEVRALFPSKANIDQFTRREGDTVEVRINARLTRAELNNLISTHIHNSSVHAIDLVDEPGS
ncbi:MAG: MgtC/SapB family protein [Candidatus Melainabacteria bacterium]|jgi:uncharacterized membrane protein YhiD involved in acid resistance|nr:MgtC/SapB family protein [Candidatus Melainabacteria bacterium]